MKPVEDIEKLVKRFHFTVSAKMDKRIWSDVLEAQEKLIKKKSAKFEQNIWERIFENPVKLTAAAVTIIVVGFFLIHHSPVEQSQSPQIVEERITPGEMLTPISLRNAYLVGGMEAVDEQSRKAFQMLNRKSVKVSIRELQIEINAM